MALICNEGMPERYFDSVTATLNEVSLGDFEPTSEIVDLIAPILELNNKYTSTIVAIIAVEADWSMLFSIATDEYAAKILLRVLLFVLDTDRFPIQRLGPMREPLLRVRLKTPYKSSNQKSYQKHFLEKSKIKA